VATFTSKLAVWAENKDKDGKDMSSQKQTRKQRGLGYRAIYCT
jgi:hypothetical protein